MKNDVVIIGNNNSGKPVYDGGRVKTRLFYELCLAEGFKTTLIDIHNFKFRFIKIFFQVRNAIKKNCRIVIMAGPKGCRLFLPLVNFLSKNNLKNVVFCPLGIGTLDKLLEKKEQTFVSDFISKHDFKSLKDDKIGKILRRLDCVVLENQVLESCYKEFYLLDNCHSLPNFRNVEFEEQPHVKENNLKICFFGRVSEDKGILDLIDVVSCLNNLTPIFCLDIYGEIQINKDIDFLNLCTRGISYKGICNASDSYNIISKYDLFCLPTKYHGEGIPGAVVESLICGTPVLISSYNQVKELINEQNGFIFEINNKKSLMDTLIYISNHKDELLKLRHTTFLSGKSFLYSSNREAFLDYICGVKKS